MIAASLTFLHVHTPPVGHCNEGMSDRTKGHGGQNILALAEYF